MTIALHTCCGPCLIEPLESLAVADDVVVVYANPNIAPQDEYERRRATMMSYAALVGAETVELAYEPESWMQVIAGTEHDRRERCAACYRLRLGMVAQWAVEHGADEFATTLSVSPHQVPELIREAGEQIAAAAGISYIHRDFRDRYPSATQRARALGLYRQNYCGCLLSRQEAEDARSKRRSDRDAARRVERDASADSSGDLRRAVVDV